MSDVEHQHHDRSGEEDVDEDFFDAYDLGEADGPVPVRYQLFGDDVTHELEHYRDVVWVTHPVN